MKKGLLIIGALAIAVATVPMFAAFEAHVINVTARIENALAAIPPAISYGTVFPQEELDRPIIVALSRSFLTEPRVDDVSYVIRQKPKCAITTADGAIQTDERTATGHVIPDGQGGYTIDCGPAPRELQEGEIWGPLPSLCPYLSKHKADGDQQSQESGVPAFHQPFSVSTTTVSWLEAKGYLSKIAGDVADDWTIDLKVPCFGGYCGQDWQDFVKEINPEASPEKYIQPIGNEHKIYGCDLWIEVTGVSESNG